MTVTVNKTVSSFSYGNCLCLWCHWSVEICGWKWPGEEVTKQGKPLWSPLYKDDYVCSFQKAQTELSSLHFWTGTQKSRNLQTLFVRIDTQLPSQHKWPQNIVTYNTMQHILSWSWILYMHSFMLPTISDLKILPLVRWGCFGQIEASSHCWLETFKITYSF